MRTDAGPRRAPGLGPGAALSGRMRPGGGPGGGLGGVDARAMTEAAPPAAANAAGPAGGQTAPGSAPFTPDLPGRIAGGALGLWPSMPQTEESEAGPADAARTPGTPEAEGGKPEAAAAPPAEAPTPEKPAEPGAAEPEDAPAEPSPKDAVAGTTKAVTRRARASAKHQSEGAATGAAMAASNEPEVTRRRAAEDAGSAAADGAETADVDRQAFRNQLAVAIRNAIPQPKSKDDAKRLMNEGGKEAAANVQSHLGGHVATATGALPGAVDEANQPDPAAMEGGEAAPLEPETAGEKPAPVAAGPVVPPPSTAQAVDMSENRAASDQLAAENDIDDDMLARGKDPQFDATLGAKAEAEKHDVEGPAQLRAAEATDRAATGEEAAGTLNAGLADFHGTRVGQLGKVAGAQSKTAGVAAARKAEITARLEQIGRATRTAVTGILDAMLERAGEIFRTAIDEALKAYDRAFDDVRGGFAERITDFFTGNSDARFEAALQAGRDAFDARVTRAIDEVAIHVETEIARAKARVEQGRAEISRFIREELPKDERKFAKDAAESITADFDALEGEIDARRDAVVDRVVEIYREGVERRNAREEELRLANRSFWERVYDATVGVVKKILKFKDMLLSILAAAAGVVGAIIRDPIGFLGNLIAGIGAGLRQFRDNIAENLKKALMGWLFGALEGAGLKLPETFDLKGILDIVLQVLGLTKENVRARAVRILGEPTVKAIETAVDFIRLLFTEGPQAVWDKLMEKLGEIKDAILDEIQNWVITKVIQAGIKWIISLLNPASAFVKACMMIYDIVVFFIERGQQIIEAVNAIINALGTIVSGNIAAMANAVEGALNRILPVVISFLASLLGLGGISDKIRQFIEAVQAPVNKAIDWIINLGVSVARKLGKLFGGRKDDKAETDPEDPEKEAKVQLALADLYAGEQSETDEGGVDLAEAEAVAEAVTRKHKVIKWIRVESGGETWNYVYSASASKTVKGKARKVAGLDANQIERAKHKAWEMLQKHLGNDKAEYRKAVDSDVSGTEISSGKQGVAYAAATLEASSEGTIAQADKSHKKIKVGKSQTEVSQQKKYTRPGSENFFMIRGEFKAAYALHVQEVEAVAQSLGLSRVQVATALKAYMSKMELPTDIRKKAGSAVLDRSLAYLSSIFIAEMIRLRSAAPSIAMGMDIAEKRDMSLPEHKGKSTLDPVTTEVPHGPKGAVKPARRRAAVAHGLKSEPKPGTKIAAQVAEYDKRAMDQLAEHLKLNQKGNKERTFKDEDELALYLYNLMKQKFGIRGT
ncbi:hypothetical protein HKCCE3408_14640 [Rhodobacterales bacterium HKCCE3408]|nr:hypothetical protein [Rhodobacterales bacterium HKCCE3408]